jgi:hypothetical protein
VTIPADQLTSLLALQARVNQLEAEQRNREQAAAEERVRLLTQKGEAENAVKALREAKDAELQTERARLMTTEERAKRYALDGELARALAAQPLVSPAAAAQLAEHFRGQFQVHAEGDSFVVRTATFETPAQFIASKLAHPDYAHFVRAGTHGGAGGQQPQALPTPPPHTAAPPEPATFADWFKSAAESGQLRGTAAPPEVARYDPSKGFGLRRAQ